MLSKKDYKELAETIARKAGDTETIETICYALKKDNKEFDEEKFKKSIKEMKEELGK